MARCRECNSKVSESMEYCPQCGVRDPAYYNVQAHDQTKVRKRSNFVVPLLGVGAIVAMVALYAENKSSDVGPSATTESAAPDYDLLHNKEFVRKNPHYGEAVRRLIVAQGYRCPALVSLTADPFSAEDAVESWCGFGPNAGAVSNWRYKVLPRQLRVSVCSGIISCD
jgi:hypothetical protein